MPRSLGDIEGMIEQKQRAGIDLTIVGSPVGVGTMMRTPGLDNFGGSDEQHAGELKAYAYANPFGSDAHLGQTAETVKDDAFVGLIVNTSVQGEYLDSERADSFFAMTSELDVPIFLHPPAEPVGSESLRDLRLVEQVARFCDLTIGFAAIVVAGRLETHPNLRLVGAMSGGAISLLPHGLDAPPRSLERIFVDTATTSTAALAANLELMGASHLLFGTDFPPAIDPLEEAVAAVMTLPISEADKESIFSGNAKRLFGADL